MQGHIAPKLEKTMNVWFPRVKSLGQRQGTRFAGPNQVHCSQHAPLYGDPEKGKGLLKVASLSWSLLSKASSIQRAQETFELEIC